MEDGELSFSDTGTPQGGLASSTLANIYLHYVLDFWFEKRFAKTCRGKAYLVRYADDYVACFTDESHAKRSLVEITERLTKFQIARPDTTMSLWHCNRR